MSANLSDRQPRRFATGIPERLHTQHAHAFTIPVNANDMVELLEWAAHGAYALGWIDLCNEYQHKQTAISRRLQQTQRPVYFSHVE